MKTISGNLHYVPKESMDEEEKKYNQFMAEKDLYSKDIELMQQSREALPT